MHPSAASGNFSISVLLPLLIRGVFFHLHILCGFLNLLVAALSMTKCEMKPVKPATRDTARQKLQPREECLSDATFGSKTLTYKTVVCSDSVRYFGFFCRADRSIKGQLLIVARCRRCLLPRWRIQGEKLN